MTKKVPHYHRVRKQYYDKLSILGQKLRCFKSVEKVDKRYESCHLPKNTFLISRIDWLNHETKHGNISLQRMRQNCAEIQRLKSIRPDAEEYARASLKLKERCPDFDLLKKRRELKVRAGRSN